MHRRLWLSVVMLTAGAGLLLAGAFASAAGSSSTPEAKLAAKVKRGGTFRVDFVSDVDHMDPALAYGTSSWWIEYATAAKLMNYPDAPATPRGTRLLPEVAASPPRISGGGRSRASRTCGWAGTPTRRARCWRRADNRQA